MASALPFSTIFAVHCLAANVGNSLTAQHVSAPAPAPASDGSNIDQGIAYVDVFVFVSLISIWGFFGRILAGSISEHFLSGQDLTVIHQMGAAILPQGSLLQSFQSMVYGQIIMMVVTLLTMIPTVPLILHR